MNNYNSYSELIKPTWAPPSWIFGPVWTVLYMIITYSITVLIYKAITKQIPWIILLPFILNIIFNIAFTPIQFGLKNNTLAAIDIVLVLITLIWTMIVLWKSKYGLQNLMYINIPYLLWVIFATYLQLTVTWLN